MSPYPLLIRSHPTDSLFDFCYMLPNKLAFKATGVRASTHLLGNTSSDRHLPSPLPVFPSARKCQLFVSFSGNQRQELPLMSLHRISHFLSSPCLLFLLPFPNQSTPTSIYPSHSGREERGEMEEQGKRGMGERGKREGSRGGRRRGPQEQGDRAHGSWRNEGLGLWGAKGEEWAWK